MTARLAPLLHADAMRAADQATVRDWGVPGRVLMETAGREATREILARWPNLRAATVLVGTGNNGGDGLVVARVLAARGVRVQAVVLPGEGTPDRTANLDHLRQHAQAGASVDIVLFDCLRQLDGDRAGLVVDGLLGIGARGALREPVASLCRWMAEQPAPVAALDTPSGLDATTGAAASGTPRAALTVAFGALKPGLLLGDGPQHTGDVVTVEIGISDALLRQHATAWHAGPEWAGATLPHRAADAHKYSAGRALAVVGSASFTGAAVLSTASAYRAGAGAVVACVPQSARAVVDARNTEVMVDAQPETDAGTLALRALSAIAARAENADAVLVGCGLGRHDDTDALVRQLVATVEAPLVLDADGLGAFTDHADRLAARSGALVMTPHLGELRRLVGDDAYDPADRVQAVRELAARWGATVVFKGMPSVAGTPEGRVIVGPPGNPALATAGSGDTLAGSITGLLAQGLAPADAAVCALWLGAQAARQWGQAHGAAGLVASDLVDCLPAAARALRS